jgi:glycosyltransferase involved in cell wall biosynthesis
VTKSTKMRILELCLSPDLGGLELYMLRCCRALSERASVLAVVAAGSRLEGYLQKEGLPAQTLVRRNKPLPLLAAQRLAKIIDDEAVAIVHMHWGKDLPLAAFAKTLSQRKPKLVSTRQMQITRPKRDFYHDFLYRQIDLNITITQSLAADMQRLLNPAYSDRVVPLYYGVAKPDQFMGSEERQQFRQGLGIAESTFLVGLFGRIKHYKGQHLLVEAISRALGEGADVAALIVGHAMEPDYLARLKQQVKEAGLEHRILFRDFVEQPQRWMQACDTVALTTVEETFGLVLVEAMRSGVAVIGSDRGGVPEIIEHEKSGLLFRSEDADDLFWQLKRLWSDRAFCAQLALTGKARSDELFDEDLHFPALYNLLTAAVGTDNQFRKESAEL